jgi:hypothetical protein
VVEVENRIAADVKKCGLMSSRGQNPMLPVGESMYTFSLRQSKVSQFM